MVGPKKWIILKWRFHTSRKNVESFCNKKSNNNPRTWLPSAKKKNWRLSSVLDAQHCIFIHASYEGLPFARGSKHTPQKTMHQWVCTRKQMEGFLWLGFDDGEKLRSSSILPKLVIEYDCVCVWVFQPTNQPTNQPTIRIWNKRGIQKQCFSLKQLGPYATCSCECFSSWPTSTYITCLPYNLQLFVIV